MTPFGKPGTTKAFGSLIDCSTWLPGRRRGRPRFDLRGVAPIVALELGYALQCRSEARGAAITPLIFGQVVGWLRERPVDALLIGSDAAWARAAEERFTPATRANPLAWVRY